MIRAIASFVFVGLPVFAASSILLKRHSQFVENGLVSLSLKIFLNDVSLKFKTIFSHKNTDLQKLDFGLTFRGRYIRRIFIVIP